MFRVATSHETDTAWVELHKAERRLTAMSTLERSALLDMINALGEGLELSIEKDTWSPFIFERRMEAAGKKMQDAMDRLGEFGYWTPYHT